MTWEYEEVFLDIRHGWYESLNDHGEQGYELVAVVEDPTDEHGNPTPTARRLIYKRPKDQHDE